MPDLVDGHSQLIRSGQAGEGGNRKSVGDQEPLLFEAILNHAQDNTRGTNRLPLLHCSTKLCRDIFPFVGHDADQIDKMRENVLVGEWSGKAVRGKRMRRRLWIWVPDGDAVPETSRRHGEHGAQLSATQDAQDGSRLDDDGLHDRRLGRPGFFVPVTRPFASGD